MTEFPSPPINVARDVHDVARKFRALDGVRGLTDFDYAEIILEHYQDRLKANIAGDPDDPYWIPFWREQIKFWRAVFEFMMELEGADAGVQINIIEDDPS